MDPWSGQRFGVSAPRKVSEASGRPAPRVSPGPCSGLVDATLLSDREARFLSPAYSFRVTEPRGKVHPPLVLSVSESKPGNDCACESPWLSGRVLQKKFHFPK